MINRREFLGMSTLILSSTLTGLTHGREMSGGQWHQLANLPFPVQEIYPALYDGRIHVAGGFEPGKKDVSATDRHFRYNISADRWSELAPLPEARHHPALAACQGDLYALGGFMQDDAGDWVMQNQTWRYDVGTDRWSDDVSAPEVHGETVCLVFDDLIHVIGGRTPKRGRNRGWADHTDSDRHLLLDVSDGTWHRASPALHPRNSAAGAVIEGLLYVVGGRTVASGNLDVLEVYDPKEDRWRLAAPMPQAQGGLAAASLKNSLIAFGGEYFGREGHGVYGEAWNYDPERDLWTALPSMLTPRHGLGAVSDGNTVFAIAGATRVGANGTSKILEAFTVD